MRLNKLPEEQKSSNFFLPEYNIVNFSNHNASVWEYIPGQNLARKNSPPETPGSFIKEHGHEELKMKLVRLDDVLGLMNICDIHGENVIMKTGDGDKIVDIVPVDLENVYTNPKGRTPTSLSANSIRQDLIERELYNFLTPQEKE